jgi:hypothetical protein
MQPLFSTNGAERRAFEVLRSRKRPDSVIRGIQPGEYSIRVFGYPGYVSGVSVGGADLLASGTLAVQPGAAVGPIEVSLQRDGGTLLASLNIENVPEDMGLLLVPLFASGPGPQQDSVRGRRECFFANLAPGDYMLYALEKASEFLYGDPEAIRRLSGGVPVRVEAGREVKVQLTKVSK